MAYLPTTTTLEMSTMMMVTIKLITSFKYHTIPYHTIPMYCKSELLVFIVNDHGQFQILETLLTGRRAPQPLLGRMLGGPQSWSAYNGEDRNLLPLLEQTIIHWLSTCCLATILTQLPVLTEGKVEYKDFYWSKNMLLLILLEIRGPAAGKCDMKIKYLLHVIHKSVQCHMSFFSSQLYPEVQGSKNLCYQHLNVCSWCSFRWYFLVCECSFRTNHFRRI